MVLVKEKGKWERWVGWSDRGGDTERKRTAEAVFLSLDISLTLYRLVVTYEYGEVDAHFN